VEFLEQPLVPDDLEGLARCARSRPSTSCRWSWTRAVSLPRHSAACRARGRDQHQARQVRSLREALRMVATARATDARHGRLHDRDVAWDHGRAHFTPLVDAPIWTARRSPWTIPLPATIEQGQIRLPTEPGLGVRRR